MDKLKTLLESGIRNINKITEGKKWVDIYFHEDLDGVTTAIGMKKYLEDYGIKLRNCYVIQYSTQYKVKKPSGEPDVITALVDFSNGNIGYTIHIDHHSGQKGVSPETVTHFRKAPSNVETISGVISPKDVFPPEDIKWINMIDSADFFKYGIKPDELIVSQPEFTDNTDDNKRKMLLATNRILLVYKNSNNLMVDTVKQAEPSIISLYQTVKKLSKNFPDIQNIDKNAQKFQKELTQDQPGIKFYDNGLLVVNSFSMERNIGAYDRYAMFKAYPDTVVKIQQFPGMIQITKNPFKKSVLNIQGITNSILAKYKKYLDPIRIGVAKIKGSNVFEEKPYQMGFKYKDLLNLYGGKIDGLTKDNEPKVKELLDKPYQTLSQEDKDWLNTNFTVSLWDLIEANSGGHPTIYNIAGLMNITNEMEEKTHIKEKLIKDLIKKFSGELEKITQPLTEIQAQTDDISFDTTDELRLLKLLKGRKQKIELTQKQRNSMVSYKGYRMLLIERNRDGRLFIFLPKRDFAIGFIDFFIKKYRTFSTREVRSSYIHTAFRDKGIGRIMYRYFVESFPIVESDNILHKGSFRIWSTMDEYFGGTLFSVEELSYDYEYILKPITGLDEKNRKKAIKNTDTFVYIHKKSNMPKALQYLAFNDIKDIFDTLERESTFLRRIKQYNEGKLNPYENSVITDLFTIYGSGNYGVHDRQYSFYYVLNFDKKNEKIKIKKILISKINNINLMK